MVEEIRFLRRAEIRQQRGRSREEILDVADFHDAREDIVFESPEEEFLALGHRVKTMIKPFLDIVFELRFKIARDGEVPDGFLLGKNRPRKGEQGGKGEWQDVQGNTSDSRSIISRAQKDEGNKERGSVLYSISGMMSPGALPEPRFADDV